MTLYSRLLCGRRMHPLVLALACLISLIPRLHADFLQITSDCNGTLSTSGSTLSTMGSCSGNPGTITENDFASYSSLGSIMTASSAILGGAQDLSLQNITIGGISMGTMVDLNIDLRILGSYNYSISASGFDDAAVFVFPTLEVGTSSDTAAYLYATAELIPIYSCGQTGNIACQSNPGSIVSTTGHGAYSYDYLSGAFEVPAGVSLQLIQAIEVQAQAIDGSMTADFLDPTSISNISVTDPTMGQPILGATITSDAGITFPVNSAPTATPEPSMVTLFGVGIVLALVGRRRGGWQNKH